MTKPTLDTAGKKDTLQLDELSPTMKHQILNQDLVEIPSPTLSQKKKQ